MPTKHESGGLRESPTPTVTVGIDPSLTSFALVVLSTDGAYDAYVHQSSFRGVERLMDISLWLSLTLRRLRDDGLTVMDVAMEDTVLHSYAASKLGELAGVTKASLYSNLSTAGRFPLRVPPSTLKKFATGTGAANKKDVISAVARKWGPEFTDDNMADAYVLARVAMGSSADPDEQAILDQLRDPKFRDQPSQV